MGKLDKKIKEKAIEDVAEKEISKEEVKAPSKEKTFIASKTIKIRAGNSDFNLIAGEQVPSGISEPFLQSLLSSKLIK